MLFLGIVANPLCIVTEFCAGGSLLKLLESNAEISESYKLKWLNDIASGMVIYFVGFLKNIFFLSFAKFVVC